MTLFSDIHTYLVISFLLMAFLIYKYAYRQAVSFIQNGIAKIANSISSAEDRKEQAENQLADAEKSMVEVNENREAFLKRAQLKAEEIISSSNKSVQQIVKQKEKEYNHTIQKIKNGLSLEIQKRIVSLSTDELIRMIQAKKNKREMHNIAIERSIEMLEAKSRENSSF